MGKTPSLVYQITVFLNSLMCSGQSKHNAKAESLTPNSLPGIYSFQTLRTYIKQCCEFAKWSKKTHEGKYLEDIRKYVPEYLECRKASGISPYTIRLDASALAKLYQCSSRDWGVELPKRTRAGITRSRAPRAHDLEFSEKANANVVNFCKGTGPRRHELIALAPSQIATDGTYIIIEKGKGGKRRVVPVLPEYQMHVLTMRNRALSEGRKRVFYPSEIKNRMDQHSYRREYAQRLYTMLESTGEYTTRTYYYCRKDKAGTVYDRGIMRAVSMALGHSRIDVIAQSYLD